MIDLNTTDRRASRAPQSTAEPQPADLRAIVKHLGGDLHDGGRRALIPGPGHGRRDRSLSLRIGDHGGVVFHSFAGDSDVDVRAYLGLTASQAARQSPAEARAAAEHRKREEAAERARKGAFCRAVWAEVIPATGTPVETYLRGRGLSLPMTQAIGFHPDAPLGYERRESRPAMIALATGADGCPAGLHVTYLRPDGSGKANIDKPRKVFGSGMLEARVQTGSVPADGVLAVSEGIESGLSFTQITGRTVWPCLSAPALGRFIVPAGVRRLEIAADNDDAGREAAKRLAERASRRCDCAVYLPPRDGEDWNDYLQGQAA